MTIRRKTGGSGESRPLVCQDGLYADFHSCRHRFIPRRGGRVGKALTGDIRLTLQAYTHVELQDQTAAIRAMPGRVGREESRPEDERQRGIAGLGGPVVTRRHVKIARVCGGGAPGSSARCQVGGPAVEFFTSVIAPPIRKRQQEWMASIAEALRQLEEKQRIVVDELQHNDAFIDTVMQASQAAVRTANEEKRKALRNTILNAALPDPPDEDKRQLFVNLVDELTRWHLRILFLFADPPKWFQERGKAAPQSFIWSLSQLITTAYPELENQREFYDLIGNTLYQRGLMNTDGLHTMMGGHGAFAKRTTPFADEFLNFINDPRK